MGRGICKYTSKKCKLHLNNLRCSLVPKNALFSSEVLNVCMTTKRHFITAIALTHVRGGDSDGVTARLGRQEVAAARHIRALTAVGPSDPRGRTLRPRLSSTFKASLRVCFSTWQRIWGSLQEQRCQGREMAMWRREASRDARGKGAGEGGARVEEVVR